MLANETWGALFNLWGGQNTGDGTQALSATGAKIGQVFTFESDLGTDTITHVGYYYSGKNGTGPSATGMKAGLQGVDTGGLPDGTYLGGGSPASVTFAPTTAGNFEWQALANSVVLTRGNPYSVVLEHNEVDGTNYMTAGTTIGAPTGRSGIPYGLVNTGSWVKNTVAPFKLAIKSASRVYMFPITNGFSTVNFGATATRGILFKVPSSEKLPIGSTYKIKGVRFRGRNSSSASANTWKIILWESSSYSGSGTFTPTTKLAASGALDHDVMNNNLTDATLERYFDGGSALPSLNVDQWYVLEIAHQDSTNMIVDLVLVQSAADWDAFNGGQYFALAARTASSYAGVETDTTNAFTITATTRILGELIFAGFTFPAAGVSNRIVQIGRGAPF